MRAATVAAGLLVVLLAVPASSSPLWSGPFVGVAADGTTDTHAYSTHPPETMCAAIYIPHLFVVTLHAAPTDTLQLDVHGQTATTSGGVATTTFIANYCTGFDIHVTGIEVAAGPYAVVVEHVNIVHPGVICCMEIVTEG